MGLSFMKKLAIALIASLLALPAYSAKLLTTEDQEAFAQQMDEFFAKNPRFKKEQIGKCLVMSTPGVYCFARGRAKNTFWRAFTPATLYPPFKKKGSSYIQLFQTDCVNYRVRAVRTTFYSEPDLRGQISDLKETRDWEYPAPDELYITIGMDAICGK